MFIFIRVIKRETKPAAWDESNQILSVLPVHSFGTWFGISKQGRLVFLVNPPKLNNLSPVLRPVDFLLVWFMFSLSFLVCLNSLDLTGFALITAWNESMWIRKGMVWKIQSCQNHEQRDDLSHSCGRYKVKINGLYLRRVCKRFQCPYGRGWFWCAYPFFFRTRYPISRGNSTEQSCNTSRC